MAHQNPYLPKYFAVEIGTNYQHHIAINWFIQNGYLARTQYTRPESPLDHIPLFHGLAPGENGEPMYTIASEEFFKDSLRSTSIMDFMRFMKMVRMPVYRTFFLGFFGFCILWNLIGVARNYPSPDYSWLFDFCIGFLVFHYGMKTERSFRFLRDMTAEINELSEFILHNANKE